MGSEMCIRDRLNVLFQTVRTEQEAKNRLISNVAHQLRTPLTTIRLRADLAKNATDPAPHLLALDREAKRAGGLAAQLMQLENDGAAEELVELDLSLLVRSLISDHRLQFEHAGVKLELQEEGEGGVVVGAKVLVGELLSNLLDNCLQHAEAKTVVVAIDGSVLRVTDDGKGVDIKSIDLLFERFFKAHAEQGAGYGLGLSIVREFAIRMGAKVRVEDNNGLSVSVAFRAV